MSGETILCPKCGSDQLTSQKHGYSAGKAVAGAVLTGGIGLVAGFHGSKKLDIYCLKCGNRFKPGEGKVIYRNPVAKTPVTKISQEATDRGWHENKAKEILRAEGLDASVKYYEESMHCGNEEATRKVLEIAHIYSIKGPGIPIVEAKKTGCLGSILLLISISVIISLVVPCILSR